MSRLINCLRILLPVLFFFIIPSCSTNVQTGTFLSISDVHFDPFHNGVPVDTLVNSPYQQWDKIFHNLGNNKYNGYYKDSGYTLFTSFLMELSAKSSNPNFIIFTGDFIAHDFLDTLYARTNNHSRDSSDSFIHKTFGFITSKINQYFPSIPIFFALGNNDSYTGDYNSVWNGAFFHQTSGILFDNFIKDPEYKKSFLSTYPVSGCYSLPFPGDKNKRIISLNANFLSENCPPKEGVHGKDVLIWLENELKSARANNEKVWIINHILPGINVFGTMDGVAPGDKITSAEIFFTDDYNSTLVSIIKKYSDVIIACFGGHIHMDDFRLYKDKPGITDPALAFIRINPSVSPVFGNNPAFQVYNYDQNTFKLLDYNTYYLDLGATQKQWAHEYNFNTQYNQHGINTKSLNSVYSDILNEPQIRSDYINFYPSSSSASSIESKWVGNWSGISNLNDTSFVIMYNNYAGKNKIIK